MEQGERPNLSKITESYNFIQHKASITFGEEGDKLKQERDSLYLQIVGIVAQNLLDQKGLGAHELLRRTLTSMEQGNIASGKIMKFYGDVAGKIAELAGQRNPQE